MAEEARGFLSRWARRKTDVLQGKPLDESAPAPVPDAATQIAPGGAVAPTPETAATAPAEASVPLEEKLLTLDDVKLLDKNSDFKPFMAGDVGPEVRNAAMKKLFADPHFNVMDGLDIYIDDYSKSDPIPESMLRQMASAKFLNLFDDKEEDEKAAQTPSPRETANNPADEIVAQSDENPDVTDPAASPKDSSQPESSPGSGASQEHHAHTDLRLQPDDAPPAPDAGRGT
ncbi:DUF3306 domain-containing protein [Polaromonas sp. A23]|uniref:DUF3306 domain-containing protein n=1 Tax=Polaromonas sp. A23 TaxID=1944133 RepID=UPI000986F80E|nr:DUF3306 domain-containing protein [Polaromonas sp. A23]OOG41097.1 hypothetical protein B0B52_12195 [Polaromonas sp. A23]